MVLQTSPILLQRRSLSNSIIFSILTLKIGVYESTSKNSGAANIWSWVMSRTILESTCPELSKKNYSGSKAQWEHFQPTNRTFLLQYMTIPVLTILWERNLSSWLLEKVIQKIYNSIHRMQCSLLPTIPFLLHFGQYTT